MKVYRELHSEYLDVLHKQCITTTDPLYVMRWHSGGTPERYHAYGVKLSAPSYLTNNYVDSDMWRLNTGLKPRLFVWSTLQLDAVRNLLSACDENKNMSGPVILATSTHRFHTNGQTPLQDLLKVPTSSDVSVNLTKLQKEIETAMAAAASATDNDPATAAQHTANIERLTAALIQAESVANRVNTLSAHTTTINIDAVAAANQPRDWYLYAVPCHKFEDTFWMHYRLTRRHNVRQYMQLLHTWSLEMAIIVECFLANHGRFQSIYSTFMNNKLTVLPIPNNKIPLFNTVSFDFETVTPDSNRIPFGDTFSDILFSASFTILDGVRGLQTQETVFNVPLRHMTDHIRDDIVRELQMGERHDDKDHFALLHDFPLERRVHVYNNERDCLKHVIDLLHNIPRVSLLLGYNSAGYDLKYLALRAAAYAIPLNLYGDLNQLTVGTQLMHVDVFRTVTRFFNELNQYSLKAVSKKLLNRTKVDVNARLIRYIYRDILQYQRIEPKGYLFRHTPSQTTPITLTDLGLYNDVDAILVHELWYKLGLNMMLNNLSAAYTIPMVAISPSKSLQYLVNKFQTDALQHHTVMVYTTNDVTASSLYMGVAANNAQMSLGDTDKYCGGFNYRDSFNYYDEVYMMDMQAYYPSLIAQMNLSHETVTIVTHALLRELKLEVNSKSMLDRFNMFHFSNHKHTNERHNLIAYRNFVDDTQNNAIHPSGQTMKNLEHKSAATGGVDRRIILVSRTRVGILARLMVRRNELREMAKATKGALTKLERRVSTRMAWLNQHPHAATNTTALTVDEYAKLMDVNTSVPSLDEEKLVLFRVSSLMDADADEALFNRMSVEQLAGYLELVRNEATLIGGQYRNMKVVNSSVYGLTGAKSGLFSGLHLASATTMLGRKYILESAAQSNELGYELVLSDTDSIFLHDPLKRAQDSDMVLTRMLAINPGLILNYQMYHNVLVFAKKTYIAMVDGEFMSRGMNKNGPQLWHKYMVQFYTKYIVNERQNVVDSAQAIQTILEVMYRDTYEEVRRNKAIVLCTNNVKQLELYRTNTPIRALLLRIRMSHPMYTAGRKLTVFHRMDQKCTTTALGIDFELAAAQLSQINIYKFFFKMHKIYYRILSTAFYRHFMGMGVVNLLDFKRYQTLNMAAFTTVYNEVCAAQENNAAA